MPAPPVPMVTTRDRLEAGLVVVDVLVMACLTLALLTAGVMMWQERVHLMHPVGWFAGLSAWDWLGMARRAFGALMDQVMTSMGVFMIFMVVNYYLVPALLLSWLALLGMRRGWMLRWILQLMASAWTLLPLIWVLRGSMSH